MNQGFYRAFEDLHRGPRDEIQARHAVYLPFVKAVCAAHPGAPVTDLGCGRGEWIELLGREGIPARGVDTDDGMLEACRGAGLDARRGDALEHLRSLDSDSQAVVSAFHLAEHLPFEVLESLVREALRVLRPGGLLIVETPNTENLAVGTSGFYMDPTHVRPLPAALMTFMMAHAGFARSKELRLNERRDPNAQEPVSMMDILAGVSPDYAVVAQKAGRPAAGEDRAFDAAFAREYGLSLTSLGLRYDREQAAADHEALARAAEARAAALAVRELVEPLQEQLSGLDKAVRRDQLELRRQVDAAAALVQEQVKLVEQQRGELLQAYARLQQVYESTSWRVTAPIRWLGARLRKMSGSTQAGAAPPPGSRQD